MFAFRDSRGAVEVAFTDRFLEAGAGPGSFEELNLLPRDESEQDEVGGCIDVVACAMARGPAPHPREDASDVPNVAPGTDLVRGIVFMHQVHGADVAVVGQDPAQPDPVADALVTRASAWILAARAADCVPVLLADPERRVVAAAHAGRKGVVAGVVPRAVEEMRRVGAERLVAWVGPHACGRCYEVPADMRDEVAAVVPETRSETTWGTPALDLGAGVTAQLRAEGAEVVDVARCTIEDTDLFSYRRQGAEAGRHAGLIWVRP